MSRIFAGSLADLTALVLETDRRRTVEQELRQSFDQLDLFFSQSLDGFFFMMMDEPVRWDDTVDKEKTLDYIFEHQRITKVNDAMLRLHAATPQQFMGRRPMDVFAHNIVQGANSSGRCWRRVIAMARARNAAWMEPRSGWTGTTSVCISTEAGGFSEASGLTNDWCGSWRWPPIRPWF